MLVIKEPHELTKEEIVLFDRAVATYTQSGGSDVAMDLCYKDVYRIASISVEGSVVIALLTIKVHDDGSKDLLVSMLAGERAMDLFDEHADDLAEFAKENMCERVTAFCNQGVWDAVSRRNPSGLKHQVYFWLEV